jgi:hypothetical protein
MLERQFRRLAQQILEHDIEPRGDAAHQRVGQSAHQRRLAAAQEFVEHQHAAARFDDAGDFGETVGRLRDDGENQVQHGAVEAARSKRQALRVALHRNEIDRTDTRQGPAQHGVGQVEPDIVMTRWQMRQVQTGAHTGQQDASGFGGQGARLCCRAARVARASIAS